MYFPKSKIKENLYTNGKQFVLNSNNKEYVGYYYTLYNGNSYSGRGPLDINSELLKSYKEINELDVQPNNLIYDSIDKSIPNVKEFIKVKSYHPILTPKDYSNGYVIRYFNKKYNDTNIVEIDENTYSDISTKTGTYDYINNQVINLKWVITGNLEDTTSNNVKHLGVISINQSTVDNANKNMLGIKSYLKDLSQFYK